MVQKIQQANISGRLGTGFGQGLAEQIPKEIERRRLASGLQELGKQQNLDPWQAFTGLASIPGALDRPQLIQSGAELLRQRAKNQSFGNQQGQPGGIQPTFPERKQEMNQKSDAASNIPSITKQNDLEAIQKGYVEPLQQQKETEAAQDFNARPAFFDNDPQKALAYTEKKYADLRQRASDIESRHSKLTAIQDNIISRLNQHSTRLGNNAVPANVYSKIEDEAINSALPVKHGGRGLSEHQAMKEYGEKLEKIAAEYANVRSIGDLGLLNRSSSETLRNLKSLQKNFESRDDTRNLAKHLIADSGLSPSLSYSIADPIYALPDLNKEVSQIPNLSRKSVALELNDPVAMQDIRDKTLEVSKKLAPFLKKHERASPLSISRALEKKGYDPKVFLEYVEDNRDELNLKPNQTEQLGIPETFLGRINDWWLKDFSGFDEERK